MEDCWMDASAAIETRELRYFLALAEELHFARAAARIRMEQSPLSRAITRLERRLGVQLFIRTRRSTTLTVAGEALLEDARRILDDIDRARCNVIAAASGRGARLRIAIGEGIAHPRIARLFALSREEHPDVDIRIVYKPFAEQLRGLRLGTVDIGFGCSSSNDLELRCLPLWEDPIMLLIRPDHRLAEQQEIETIDSNDGPLIVLGTRSVLDSSPIARQFVAKEQGCRGIEYAANSELLLTLVAAGYGIGVITGAQAETIHRPDLIVRPLSTSAAKVTTYLIQRNEDSSRLVSRFIERALSLVNHDHGNSVAMKVPA